MTSFLLMTFFGKAQENQNSLVNKTFIAKIGSICEETPDNNPCVGEEIYLVLHFGKTFVDVVEQQISSCGEETTDLIGEFTWKWQKGSRSEIMFNPEEVMHTLRDSVALELSKGQLIGKKPNKNKNISTYHFRGSVN